MAGKMDKAGVILGHEKDADGKDQPVKLNDVLSAAQKTTDFWSKTLVKALVNDLGYMPGVANKPAGAAASAKDAFKKAQDRVKKDMKDAYIKVGLVGKDLVFRVKQKTGALSADIEEDGVLVKEYAAEKAKKADRYGVSTQGFKYVLSKEPLLKEFATYLEKVEHSGENIKFYQEIEELKDAKGLLLEKEKERIWKEYIAADASDGSVGAKLNERVRVNLPSQIFNPLSEKAKKSDWKGMTLKMFTDAQADIYKLMERDSFPRFLAGPLKQKLLPAGGDFVKPPA
ncbi:MAG: regulator of G-protein signaling domain-containing protein [Planctomycetota bacterium]